jgi:hypothetical protein
MSARYPQLADAAWLRSVYVDQGLSWVAIAEQVGCSARSVRNALERADVRRGAVGARPVNGAAKVESKSGRERRTRSELKRVEAREALLDQVERGVLTCRAATPAEVQLFKITASPEALAELAATLAQAAASASVNGNGTR